MITSRATPKSEDGFLWQGGRSIVGYKKRGPSFRCEEETFEIVRAIALGRIPKGARGFKARPPILETVERLFEIAFRCIEDHGADFGQPANADWHELAQEKLRKLGHGVQIKRRPGRPIGSRDSRPRKKPSTKRH